MQSQVKIMNLINTIRSYLLLILIGLLPFSEWKFIGLPLRGRPFFIDLDRPLSISMFDVLFVPYSLLCIPVIFSILREKSFKMFHLAFLVTGSIMLGYLIYLQNPTFPLLTPIIRNVIDARQFFIHFGVAIVFALGFSTISIDKILKIGIYYYLAIASGTICLSWFALNMVLYFRIHYPFQIPTNISFPFPSQNQAAGFLVICFLGTLGLFFNGDKAKWLIAVMPPLLLSIGLTGSRSGILVLFCTIIIFILIYSIYFYFWANRDQHYLLSNRSPFLIIPGIIGGIVLLMWNINWQPINDSLSIFDDLIQNPVTLFTDKPHSPRERMWKIAVSEVASSASEDNENTVKFKTPTNSDSETSNIKKNASSKTDSFLANSVNLNLIFIKDGCKEVVGTVKDLAIGNSYLISLDITPNINMLDDQVILKVIDLSTSIELPGSINTLLDLPKLDQFHMFLANSDRNMVSLSGKVGNLTYLNGGVQSKIDIETNPKIVTIELPYNGGATPTIIPTGEVVNIVAFDRFLRGHVTIPGLGFNGFSSAKFTFDLIVTKAHFSFPIDPAAMFYTGLSDMQFPVGNSKWDGVSNALLIQFEREMKPFEPHFLISKQKEDFSLNFDNQLTSTQLSSELVSYNNIVECGVNGQQSIRNLWWRPLGELSQSNLEKDTQGFSSLGFYTPNLVNKPDNSELKNSPDTPPWLEPIDYALAIRGSTHNVYLDFLYYNGKIALIIFLFFIFNLIFPFAYYCWRMRRSNYFILFLSVLLQMTAIFVIMYAQPYIFHKFIWVVFGFALGLLLNKDIREVIS